MSRFDSVIAPAQAGQMARGIPASVTMAQWALESAYGTRMPAGSNNPFGIKAKAGQPSVESMTWEVEGGVRVNKVQRFAKFPTLNEAFIAHSKIFFNGYYKKALTHLNDPKAFANALTGTYATDPKYGSKLIAIMDANNLYQYDKLPWASGQPAAPKVTAPAKQESFMGNLLGSVASIVEGVLTKGSAVATVATAAPNIIDGAFKSIDEAERGFAALIELVNDIKGGRWSEAPDDIKAIITEFRQIMINFGIDHDGLNEAAVTAAKLGVTEPVK